MRKMLDVSRGVSIAAIVLGSLSGGGIGVAAAQTAMPHGGQVVQGQATIATPSASRMVITQGSQRAVVNWNGFSIGPGGRLVIKQPNAQAAILNRVTGGDLSRIDGQLQANGQVYLLNPHGIVVGPGGRVDTAAFLASVLHVSDHAFMAGGSLTFSGDSTAGILNLGTIRAALGDVALFAPAVANHGTIEAPNGTAALVSGREILFAPDDAHAFYIKAPVTGGDGGTAVDNSGVIKAAQVELKAAGSAYGLAVNNSGVISATAVKHVGGRIVLDAGDGDASVSGTMTARAGDDGGTLAIHGGQVDVASGAAMQADATGHGNGGSVTVLADGETRFNGLIEAHGGAEGGDGGSAEVSGHTLWFAGRADLSAPHGRTGTLLLDPFSFTIDATEASAISTALDTADVDTETYAGVGALDSITVNAAISSNGNHTFTLDAPVVTVNADITIPNGEIDFGTFATTGPSVTSAAGATISANLVSVKGGYTTVDFAGPILTPNNGVAYNPQTGTPGSFTADNASNQIKNLYLTNNAVSLTGDVDVQSSVGMQVADQLTTTGKITLVATGGDLAFGGGGPTLNAGGTMTLASTNGAFNDNSSLTLGGAGRKLIYSSTDGGNFNVTGLAYPQYNPVSYPDDPQAGNVIYIGTASGLTLMTITADNKSVTYGSDDPTFTASYSSGSSASDLTSPVRFQVSGAHSNVGSYTITPFGATSTSRRLSFVPGTLTVTPAQLVITAVDTSMSYGSTVPGFHAIFSGFRNSDTESVVTGLSFSTSASSSSPVGTYGIVPSGASASNYTIAYANGTLTVNPAVLAVRINDATRQYGAATPVFSSLFSGFVNGDSSSIVSGDLSYSTTATASSGVGTYAITGSGLSVPGNYRLEYFPGTLTITPAPLVVGTALESVVYGQPVLAPQTLYHGLLLGDTPESLGLSVSSNVVPGTGVGTYTTTLRGSSANYAITYAPGTITVTPAPLTITAGSFERTEAQRNPPLIVTVAGLFGNDLVKNLKVTTTAGDNSYIGTYPITVTSDRMPNYDITYVNGTASVDPQPPITVTTITMNAQNSGGLDFSNNDTPVSALNPSQYSASLQTVWQDAPSSVDAAIDMLISADPTYAGDTGALKHFEALMASGSLVDHEVGKLLPFLEQEAKNILDKDPSKWSTDESHFISFMTDLVSKQKKKAAAQAAAQLAQWKQDQVVEKQKQGLGALLDTGTVPPDTFLTEARSGVALDSTNIQAYTAVMVSAATLGAVAVAGGTAAVIALPTLGAILSAATASAIGGTAVTVVASVAVAVAAVAAIVATAVKLANMKAYDQQMDQAVADAQKPVTASDLKALLSTTNGQKLAFSYLAATVANDSSGS